MSDKPTKLKRENTMEWFRASLKFYSEIILIESMFKPYYLSKSNYTTKYTLLPYLLEHKVIRFALELTFFTKVIRLEYFTQIKKS
jgi:hypothetical protein